MAIGTTVTQNTTTLAEIKTQVNELTNGNLEVRLEPSAIREEVRSELMLLLTGKGPYASSVHALLPFLSRLSLEEKQEIVSMLDVFPLQRPNDPKRTIIFPAGSGSCDRYSAPGSPVCGCKTTYKAQRAFRRGPFSFGHSYQTHTRHHASCPYSGGEAVKRTWKYQLCMQLLPLANKTIQLGLSARTGQGSLELRFPLKVYATVQRSSSAIFRLFDDFTERCARLNFSSEYDDNRLYLTWALESCSGTGQGRYVHSILWDIGRVREELQYMRRALCDAHSLQIGSITDTDESGYTVLHVGLPCPTRTKFFFPLMLQAVSQPLSIPVLTTLQELIILIMQLMPVYAHVSAEICDLLKLVSRSSNDTLTVASMTGPRRLKPNQFLNSKMNPASPRPEYVFPYLSHCVISCFPCSDHDAYIQLPHDGIISAS